MSYKNIAGVAVEKTNFSFDKEYDYLYDNSVDLKPGCRVLVPFGKGNKCRQGIVTYIRTQEESVKGIKKISSVLDEEPVLSEELVSMMHWLKEKTFCTLFEAARSMLPAGMCHRTITTYTTVRDADTSKLNADELQIYNYINDAKKLIDGEKVLKTLGFIPDITVLDKLVRRGYLLRNFDSVQKTGDLTVSMVRITQAGIDILDTGEKMTSKQREVLRVLSEVDSFSLKEICYFTGYTSAVIKALENKGLVEVFEVQVYRNPYDSVDYQPQRTEIVLNDEQQKAYDNMLSQFNEGNGDVSLLYGVTGSGKTQVYLKMIDYMLERNKQVIVMVPEISLTPQTLNIFHKRYGRNVAVFHSGLSSGQRIDEWKRVRNSEVQIVIGTRSAVFAPFDNLGLIIVDEEQEHTYKSEQTPRYNAKDVARFRCGYHKSLLILASATPSLESFAKAKQGHYSLNRLTKRYSQAQLPDVRIVDMYTEALSESSFLSKELFNSLVENLNNQKQSILLMNRRGYNTFASCKKCGYVFTCPSCSISMTYHHDNGRLMCHYCGYSQKFTTQCPECESSEVRYSGYGTQKIEDELAFLLPEARILRLDADSTMTRFSHEDKLNAFARGEYDILLGTQMVAKGLDFENVTLVGVINADVQLNNDDFRSQERTFDLLTQVVGRAGRGKFNGKAIIQTTNPENDVIRIASVQDYDKFFRTEMDIRKALIYPPYCDIVLIGFSGIDENQVRAASAKMYNIIIKKLNHSYNDLKVIILGPMSARITRVNRKYRYRLILKCKNTQKIRKMFNEALCEYDATVESKSVAAYIDINPENIL